MDDSKRLLTAREAAKYVFGSDSDAAYQRFHRIIKKSDIPTIQAGRRTFISRAAIDAALGLDRLPSEGTVVRLNARAVHNSDHDSR